MTNYHNNDISLYYIHIETKYFSHPFMHYIMQ